VHGTLLLAHEGINGTISGRREDVDAVLDWLRADPRLAALDHKESLVDEHPFLRTKVKLKKEIVTMGIEDVDPNRVVGTYLSGEDWNRVISDPETLLIDTRNDYEYEVGTFAGAINPHTKSFREFPEYVREHLDPEKHKREIDGVSEGAGVRGGLSPQGWHPEISGRGSEREFDVAGRVFRVR